MEVVGRSEDDVDRVVSVDDLSVTTLVRLIARLQQTVQAEQFIFREVELDEAYRQADQDLRKAQEEIHEERYVTEFERARQLIIEAHDLVGLSLVTDAVNRLNRVIEIKLGIADP